MPFGTFKKFKVAVGHRFRERRARLFRELFPDAESMSILDLGGGAGAHIASVLPSHSDITVAEVNGEPLKVAREQYGFKTRLIPKEGRLPFADNEFDLVFCSSVIEHATGPKRETKAIRSTREFRERAELHQACFAQEIRRIARSYFVQTPHKHFIVESHTNTPGFVMLLPRPAQLAVWKLNPLPCHGPDFHLFTTTTMHNLFPDSEIHIERVLGMPKSIMAVRRAPVRMRAMAG